MPPFRHSGNGTCSSESPVNIYYRQGDFIYTDSSWFCSLGSLDSDIDSVLIEGWKLRWTQWNRSTQRKQKTLLLSATELHCCCYCNFKPGGFTWGHNIGSTRKRVFILWVHITQDWKEQASEPRVSTCGLEKSEMTTLHHTLGASGSRKLKEGSPKRMKCGI